MPFGWVIDKERGNLTERAVPAKWSDWVKEQVGTAKLEEWEQYGPGPWVVAEPGAYIVSYNPKGERMKPGRRIFAHEPLHLSAVTDTGFTTRLWRVRPVRPGDPETDLPARYGPALYRNAGWWEIPWHRMATYATAGTLVVGGVITKALEWW